MRQTSKTAISFSIQKNSSRIKEAGQKFTYYTCACRLNCRNFKKGVDSVLLCVVHYARKGDLIRINQKGTAAMQPMKNNRGKEYFVFKLDVKSHKSIYEQVMDNMKEQIMTGQLAEGAKLPSVREMSKIITVNPNTVQKAYRELERQGFIYTTSGVGTFVANRKEITADQGELKKVMARLDDAFRQLLYMGLDFESAKGIVDELIEKLNPINGSGNSEKGKMNSEQKQGNGETGISQTDREEEND